VKIHVVHPNKLGKEKATRLISDNFLKLKHLVSNATYQPLHSTAESDTIMISGSARGAKFDGLIKISETNVVIEGELSGLSVMFFTQKTVEDFIAGKLTEFGL
jgi:hypothetical protein